MARLRPPSKEESQLLPPYAALEARAIFVPRSEAEFTQARSILLAQEALGFDTESKPVFQAGQNDSGPHVVQLATPDAAWILQLHHPQALALAREVMGAPHILKVGFGLDNDLRTLPLRLGSPVVHVLDLDKVLSQHGYGPNAGVRAAMALVLERSFSKSKRISTSNWAAQQLSEAQIRYAANDAHAPALIYAALPAWQASQPTPPHASTKRRRAGPSAQPQPSSSTAAAKQTGKVLTHSTQPAQPSPPPSTRLAATTGTSALPLATQRRWALGLLLASVAAWCLPMPWWVSAGVTVGTLFGLRWLWLRATSHQVKH